MKILLISPTQSGIGGIAQHVQGLTKFLKKKGYCVEITSSENTFTIPIKGLKNPSFMLSGFIKSTFKKNFDIIHFLNYLPLNIFYSFPVFSYLLNHKDFFRQK